MNTKIINSIPLTPVSNKVNNPETNVQTNFSDVLKNAIENVNRAQLVSDQKTEAFAMGENIDLHDVMITAQKASITLETTVQIQKRVIDAYNEIMRMQV